MPKMYRTMKMLDDAPMIGPSKTMLGAVIAGAVALKPGQTPDLSLTPQGLIEPLTGGMSVAPEIGKLRSHQIPMCMSHLFKDATGSNKLHCWSMGNGPFTSSPVDSNLNLRVDKEDEHGIVEPERSMTYEEYQSSLAATRDRWQVDEPAGVQR